MSDQNAPTRPSSIAENVQRMASGVAQPSKKPEDVPKMSKQPNSRPPVGIREHILRTPLPYYSGPYSVGMMDIEVPAREPRHFSEIKREHRHLLQLETVLFSVFYPSGLYEESLIMPFLSLLIPHLFYRIAKFQHQH